jgi:NADP-dependent alcohol dehydrogenase
MENFTFCNPVNVVFGKGSIAELPKLIPPKLAILMTCGGGSIRKNGVYEQVKKALKGRKLVEFGGIEPNPEYETLMKAVKLARAKKAGFLLSVGGGSVLDGTKFIAAAIPFKGEPWDIVAKGSPVKKATPLGCVMTLPATGSEMNPYSVISRRGIDDKRPFASPLVFPRFSILDPETTYTLPPRQVSNGIVDAWVHVMEQYMTYPVEARLQDRQAEGIWLTLREVGPRVLADPKDYDARANMMWCATQALNQLIAVGVPQDWATHMIGHQLTASYGLDHAQTLAVVAPALLRHQRARKQAKLLQYAERVWDLREGTPEDRIEGAIRKTEEFFRSVGVKTRLGEYGVGPEAPARIAEKFEKRGEKIGERGDLGAREVREILEAAL